MDLEKRGKFLLDNKKRWSKANGKNTHIVNYSTHVKPEPRDVFYVN